MIVKVEFDGSKYVAIHEVGIAPETGPNAIKFKKAGKCKLMVNGNEGTIPHFHIKGAYIDTEICLCTNKYFPHARKYEDKLDSVDEQILYDWFNEKSYRYPEFTNYQYACKVWNDLNNEGKIDFISIPDYAHMNGDYNANYKRRGVIDDFV